MVGVFRDSDFDLEEPSREWKVDKLRGECKKFYW